VRELDSSQIFQASRKVLKGVKGLPLYKRRNLLFKQLNINTLLDCGRKNKRPLNTKRT
jgi:hypothetical protein